MNIYRIKKIFIWFFAGTYLLLGMGLSSYASSYTACLNMQKTMCCCCKAEINHNNSISGSNTCNCVKDKAPSKSDNNAAIFQQKNINADKLCDFYIFNPLRLDFKNDISPEIISKYDIVPNINLNMLKNVILLN